MTLTTINLAALGQTVNLGTEVTGTLPTGNGGTGSTATTFVNAATNVTGALPIANGGTALTSGFVNGGGLTEADQWRVTSSFTGDANPIASNWERNDTDFDKIGTGLTDSSGVFSFPSTGIWLVTAFFRNLFNGDSRYNEGEINVTSNNSSYNVRGSGSAFIQQTSSSITYNTFSVSCMIDVSNTSNVKFKISMNVADNGTTTEGSSTQNRTYFTAIRLGDT